MDLRSRATRRILELLEGAGVITRPKRQAWAVHTDGTTLLVELASRLVPSGDRDAYLTGVRGADFVGPVLASLHDTAMFAASGAYVLASGADQAPEEISDEWVEWGLQALSSSVLALGILAVADKIQEQGPGMTGMLLAAVLGQGTPFGWPEIAVAAERVPYPPPEGER